MMYTLLCVTISKILILRYENSCLSIFYQKYIKIVTRKTYKLIYHAQQTKNPLIA